MRLLEIQQLAVQTAAGQRLVEPISFCLKAGENLTILGETGSGKSLLIQAIMDALPEGLSASGEIWLENRKMLPKSDRLQAQTELASDAQSLWGKALVMLPQEPRRALNPIMRIRQQLWESFHFVAGESKKSATDQAENYLTELGLANAKQAYPHELSGGMAQRAAFAIATAAGGKILLADEPTKGLDFASKQRVITLLQQVHQQGGALLTITHDIEVASQLGGYILVMRKGKLVEQGQASALLANPQHANSLHAYTQALIAADPKRWQPAEFAADCAKNSEKAPLVSVKNLSVKRGNRTLFQQLSFSLAQGEILGIVGRSGIGKSTLADVLCGLRKAQSGQVEWHRQSHKQHQVLKLYQDPPEAFAPKVSLQQLLDDVIDYHQLDRSLLPSLLAQLSLSPEILQRSAETVSGGELQRVAILRALLLEPVLLFADEVTSRLDPITQKETLALLISQCRQRRCALVIVSHDPYLIAQSCDKVINLEDYQVQP